ncbi:hypothetical protein GGI02_004044 [Coemansia sp. RSA 2322]|nr:hypothetical protein GGI02_004044 [Coemansia sp. RSA 2322]
MLWRRGTGKEVAIQKSSHMCVGKLFKSLIVDHFNENDKDGHLLKDLVFALRKYLFENPSLGPEYHGTSTTVATEAIEPKPMTLEEELEEIEQKQARLELTDGNNDEQVNPFQKRASKCADISSTLLKITEAYWKVAIKRLFNSV